VSIGLEGGAGILEVWYPVTDPPVEYDVPDPPDEYTGGLLLPDIGTGTVG